MYNALIGKRIAACDKNRTIFIGDDLDNIAVRAMVRELASLTTQSHDDITLLIDSSDHYSEHGLMLYSAIRKLDTQVNGIVLDTCGPSATLILQACKHRIAHASTILTLAPVRIQASIYDTLHAEVFAESWALQENIESIFAAHTSLSPDDIARIMQSGGGQLTAPEALQAGLLTQILR